ncbi:hypothetical protein DL767_003153 [Monosporascus sp. MG133]|nr:hypothetical protein DL767_003153 [Monosporascus sp. MG133]
MFSTLSKILLGAGLMARQATSAPASSTVEARQDGQRLVFAHYMVGITSGQTAEKWRADVAEARAAGIDGFALNAGAQDTYNDVQLPLAYEAAASVPGFKVFISFDQAASSWSPDQVAARVRQFRDSPAQFKINGLPVVSTFEGPGWADNWAQVRAATGGIYLIPDWSSLGPQGVAGRLNIIDGAFNWGAWPNANSDQITTDGDREYQRVLGDKSYMMGVSPYFYTNLRGNGWSKNWYSSSDSLWFDRWKQVLQILPDYVQIITWNDYGESSYINEPTPAQIYPGAEIYVNGFNHKAFQFVLPYFISAYKAGTANVPLPAEGAVAWYRTTPKNVCSDGGTVWGQGGTQSAALGTQDVVSIIALSNSRRDITVSIGGASSTVSPIDSFGSAYYYEVPFNGRTGPVTVSAGGRSTTGPQITNSCPAAGRVNFNAVAIQV